MGRRPGLGRALPACLRCHAVEGSRDERDMYVLRGMPMRMRSPRNPVQACAVAIVT